MHPDYAICSTLQLTWKSTSPSTPSEQQRPRSQSYTETLQPWSLLLYDIHCTGKISICGGYARHTRTRDIKGFFGQQSTKTVTAQL
eukprot:5881200-Amphidinium_carterae.2